MSIQTNCSKLRYIVFDLEVNGVQRYPWINQLGAIDPSRPKGDREFNRYFEPPLTSPDWIRWKEKFSEVNPQYISTCQQGLIDFIKWVRPVSEDTRPVVFVGHNAYKHDAPILNYWLKAFDLKIPADCDYFCTSYLANTLRIPGNHTVSGLCKTLGVTYREAHDAVNDAKMTKGIFKKMVGSAPMDRVLSCALLKREEKPVIRAAEVIKEYAKKAFSQISSPSQTVQKAPYYPAMRFVNLTDSKTPLAARVHNVVIDTETTGLLPKAGEDGEPPRVVEYAIHMPTLNETIKVRINPEIPIPRAASAVHRIYQSDIANAMTFSEGWFHGINQLHDKLDVQQKDIIIFNGYNMYGYDLRVLRAEFTRAGLGNLSINAYCTLLLVRNLFKGLVSKDLLGGFFKLEYFAPLLGINVNNAHDASVDVVLTSLVFDKIVEGVDRQQLYKAMLSRPPAIGGGNLCRSQGAFNPEAVMKTHQIACEITIPFLKRHLKMIKNPQMFEPRNLASLLDIYVAHDDLERYILWRVLLKATEGMDRKLMVDAINSKDPLEALYAINPEKISKRLLDYLEQNRGEGQITLTLGKALFQAHGIAIPDLKALAEAVGVDVFEEKLNPFEIKRIFLKLTHGLLRKDIVAVLDEPDAVQRIMDLIKEQGTFNPEGDVRILDDMAEATYSSSSSSSSFTSYRTKRLQPDSMDDPVTEEAGTKVQRT